MGDHEATFTYEPGYAGTPVSLSMPVGDMVQPWAAYNYLENLLPENASTRERLARQLGVEPTVFGLLSHIGEDVAGAVTLSPDEELHDREPAHPQEVSEDALAHYTATLRVDPSSPPPDDVPARCSLSGQQAKFALTQMGDKWFWPSAETPSTHIFKPGSAGHPLAQEAEDATLKLASQVGVEASTSAIASFAGEEALAVKRWDRNDGKRLHAEDLLQALGDRPNNKYRVPDKVVQKLLAPHGLGRPYLRQMLFNVAVGDSDVHAKNYSVLLSGGQVRLAPLYDSLPIFLWPEYEQTLSVTEGGKKALGDVEREDWVVWARRAGWEPDLVLTELDDIFPRVAALLPSTIRDIRRTRRWWRRQRKSRGT